MPRAAAGGLWGLLALGCGASIWLGPATPLPAVLAVSLLFGIFQGTINPPITNSAVSAMPRSMAGVATSLASAGRWASGTAGRAGALFEEVDRGAEARLSSSLGRRDDATTPCGHLP